MFRIKKLVLRFFCCSSLPNRLHFTRFRFGIKMKVSGIKPPDNNESPETMKRPQVFYSFQVCSAELMAGREEGR